MEDTSNSSKSTAKTEKQTNSKYVETIREGATGINIYVTNNASGSSHYAEVKRAYPRPGTDKDKPEFNYSARLYAKHLKQLEQCVAKAASRVAELDQQSDTAEEIEFPANQPAA